MIQGAKNIGELLANFIELLQVSTNREGEFGTLAEEISTLKKYIALQEVTRAKLSARAMAKLLPKFQSFYPPR